MGKPEGRLERRTLRSMGTMITVGVAVRSSHPPVSSGKPPEAVPPSTPGSSGQGPRRYREGRTKSFRLGSSRAGEKQSRMSEVPCQAVSSRAGSKQREGRGGGLLKAVGVGWTSCHITGGGSQAPLTAISASTGWTICSTWPMESKGNSAPVPTVPSHSPSP